MDYDEACLMDLTPARVMQRLLVYRIVVPYAQNIPDSFLKREGGNLSNSGLSSQVHYIRTV